MYYYEIIMKFSCSQKRKCEVVWAFWKRQAELYDAGSDAALEIDSQDSEDHSVHPQDL